MQDARFLGNVERCSHLYTTAVSQTNACDFFHRIDKLISWGCDLQNHAFLSSKGKTALAEFTLNWNKWVLVYRYYFQLDTQSLVVVRLVCLYVPSNTLGSSIKNFRINDLLLTPIFPCPPFALAFLHPPSGRPHSNGERRCRLGYRVHVLRYCNIQQRELNRNTDFLIADWSWYLRHRLYWRSFIY